MSADTTEAVAANSARSAPFPGSPLARGPMGGDQFTQIHNGVFRDLRLSAKAMGIFAHLSTHQEGWRVDERTIGRAMRDGRDAIRTGLHELEKHHYLIRDRERRPDGRLGEAVWFYTDLPAQIRALGITDENLVVAKVREAFEAWQVERTQHRRSKPITENPSLGLTSGNSAAQAGAGGGDDGPVDNSPVPGCLPSSEPRSDFPTLGSPTLADPPHKNTNNQNTNQQNTNSGGPAPLKPPATDTPSGVSVPKTSTRLRKTSTTQLKSCSNPPPARVREQRARELAGPVAVAAVDADSTIDLDELVNLIVRFQPRLTQMQATTRAASLLAWAQRPAEPSDALAGHDGSGSSGLPASPQEPPQGVRGVS